MSIIPSPAKSDAPAPAQIDLEAIMNDLGFQEAVDALYASHQGKGDTYTREIVSQALYMALLERIEHLLSSITRIIKLNLALQDGYSKWLEFYCHVAEKEVSQ